MMRFVATVADGLEAALDAELAALGATERKLERRAVSFGGELGLAYRVCLWSRLASRVRLPLSVFPAPDGDALYVGAREHVRWDEHFAVTSTFAVRADGQSSGIGHSHYAALRLKDAIVDQFRDKTGTRPTVNTSNPHVRLHVYLQEELAHVSLELSGAPLHRRGYRPGGSAAPLKENLAAGLLVLAGWGELARQSAPFLDPMCGSGTLPLEAGLIAADVAPGLLRRRFGFERWYGHDEQLWRAARSEAEQRDRREAGAAGAFPPIWGFDEDPAMISRAVTACERAGLARIVRFERRALAAESSAADWAGETTGLLVVNPPYGKRLGELTALKPLYQRLGAMLRAQYAGWTACVLSGQAELAQCLGLRAQRKDKLYNGAIECRLLHYPLARSTADARGPDPLRLARSAGAAMFANRLRKNARHFARWAKREGISCYRVYDADLPEYAAAIDVYGRSAHVQEYAPPSDIDGEVAAARLHDVVLLSAALLDVSPQHVFLKVRARQRGKGQYARMDEVRATFQVEEAGSRFVVNLSDYLDTGLFLDQRLTRGLIRKMAAGRDFLNLFCYTASASVYAASGGARSTTSVDLSATYLAWAEQNFALNGVQGHRHQLVQADCLEWIRRERRRYGLVYLEPPTFSRSKRMRGTFDVQRDHARLIRATVRLLAAGGIMLFATNFRGFTIDRAQLTDLKLRDLSRATLPPDFARTPQMHHVWQIEVGVGGGGRQS